MYLDRSDQLWCSIGSAFCDSTILRNKETVMAFNLGHISIMTVKCNVRKQNLYLNRCMQLFWRKIRFAIYVCRSLVTVVGKNIRKADSCLSLKKLSNSMYKPCEMPELDHVLKALNAFRTYFTRLNKVGQEIKYIFLLYNMALMFMHYECISDLSQQKNSE